MALLSGRLPPGFLLGVGGPLTVWMAESVPLTLLVFALLSLVSWFGFRKALGVRDGDDKIWDRDINED